MTNFHVEATVLIEWNDLGEDEIELDAEMMRTLQSTSKVLLEHHAETLCGATEMKTDEGTYYRFVMSTASLESMLGFLAYEANRCRDKRRAARLHDLCDALECEVSGRRHR